MKKKFMAIMLIAPMSVGLIACGSKSDSGSNKTDKKVLSVQLGPNPETLDPALNSAIDGGNMILHAFECLLTLDQDGKPKAGQAEKWESSKDGLTWTFHLRDGLKWSYGSDLTANDYVYSFKRVADPNTGAPYAATVLGMVEGFEKQTKVI